jgi:hypothetical protein
MPAAAAAVGVGAAAVAKFAAVGVVVVRHAWLGWELLKSGWNV